MTRTKPTTVEMQPIATLANEREMISFTRKSVDFTSQYVPEYISVLTHRHDQLPKIETQIPPFSHLIGSHVSFSY